MSNNKQQTAVEWFAEKTFNQIELLKHSCINEEQFLNNMLIFKEQAKEMHKQEIINSFFEGAYGGDNISGEQYYEQTYGGDKQ